MRFDFYLNQAKALEWKLNFPQALVFSHLYELASGSRYEFSVSYDELISVLPSVVDKPDTAYRLLRQLAKARLIDLVCYDGRAHYTLLDKARGWM